MRRLLLLLTALLLLTLAGCESMSPQQCKAADWQRVGYEDGARGEPEQRLADYAEDCGKVGVRPDPGLYRQGREQGLATFCNAPSGWREGTQGRSSKSDACRGRPGDPFYSRAFEAGLQVYRTNEELRRKADESRRLELRLEKSTDDGEKRSLRERLRSLDREQAGLRSLLAQQQRLAP